MKNPFDNEQDAFEYWLRTAQPHGDAEAIHDAWINSAERADYLYNSEEDDDQ